MFTTALALLSGLYVLIRGTSTVTTVTTDLVYRKEHPKQGSKEALAPCSRIHLVCHQHRTTVVYERWYMRTRVYYTYSVDVAISGLNDATQTLPRYYYPQLCGWWMTHTYYPHDCAIEAYLSEILVLYKGLV